ncbi:MAG: arginine--tRNA ligase [Candidatus Eremiobacteraeota bacterium]|nr:arginine--tRNA ligase [Candidatus Eremiobacteraeota bacterium]
MGEEPAHKAPLPEIALGKVSSALRSAIEREFGDAANAPIIFEPPRRPEFGDYATNVAFRLARTTRRSPQSVASLLVDRMREQDLDHVLSSAEAVGGFINVRLAAACWQSNLAVVLQEGSKFGDAPANGTRVSLEFGSANPTGPLVIVQGRTLSIGQTLANAMRARGYEVTTEWIINDAGAQMDALGRSLYARYRQLQEPDFPLPAQGYPGEYLIPIAQRTCESDGDRWRTAPESEWLPHFKKVARDALVAEQQHVAERFRVHFDRWQSELELHESGRVVKDLQRLTDRGLTYVSDGALYFKATQFGDDKDRVVLRSDGRPTYYAPDIAYHYEKLQRSERVIDILGPDHHGYIGRLKGMADALGFPGALEVIIAQQITLLSGDESVAMSKRAGAIVTLADILDEVGVDAARFFFIMLAPESPLKFDLALAKEQSENNPVYYVQYGHARISSVFKNARVEDVQAASASPQLERLVEPSELTLMRRLSALPRTMQNVVDQFAPHRLTQYARDVAADFHQFYTECRILVDDEELRLARLALCLAARTVLARVLELMDVTAPESM